MKAVVAFAAVAALSLAGGVQAQTQANSSFPLPQGMWTMKNDANNSFCQSYYVKVPAKTYFDFTWCQTNGNGLAIIYSDADSIVVPADGSAPADLPLCRKVDDLRAYQYDYQYIANDMPRSKPGFNSSVDSFCSQPKTFPTTCYNQDVYVFLSFSNYWSGQFDNGTLYPSSWYATSKGRDLNVTMTQVAADGKPACREAGVFATKTKPPATKGAIPTPKIEGEDPSSSASSTKITSGAAAPQLAVAVAVALFSALAGVLVLL